MVLRFSLLAVVFLLACTGVERDNPYDEKSSHYGEVLDVDGYWDSTYVKGEVEYKFTDPRDKNVYKAIEFSIGRRFLEKDEDGYYRTSDKIKDDSVYYRMTWMAQNLKFNAPGSVCYNKDESNCTTYGRLYNFETAKTACPPGWRLPNSGEEKNFDYISYLLKALGYESCYKSEPYQDSNGQTSTRCVSRWLGLGGFGSDDGFSDIDTVGYWWTSTDFKAGNAYSLHGAMTYEYYSDGTTGYYGELKKSMDDKSYFLSVRCVQD